MMGTQYVDELVVLFYLLLCIFETFHRKMFLKI